MEDAAAPEAEVGSISDEPCTMADEDALDGLSEDEAKMELLVVAADDDGELLILLDRPRFKILALLRTALVPLAAPREHAVVRGGARVLPSLLRLAARRVDLEYPLFTGPRLEAEEVGVLAVGIFDHSGNHGRQLDRVVVEPQHQ